MLTVKQQLLTACKDALVKLEWPIYTDKEIKTMQPCRKRLQLAIDRAESEKNIEGA